MLWLLFLMFPFCLCEDSPCPSRSPCTAASSCPWYTRFKNLKTTNKTQYNKILPSVKQAVCNKIKKKVCCIKLKNGDDEVINNRKTTINEGITIKLRDSDDTPMSPISHTSLNPRVSTRSLPGWIPSSSKGECGREDLMFIVGGDNTMLGEMPWTALLGAVRNNRFKWKCGGAVINKWFILTAAHCNPVTSVRLGEWRVLNTTSPIRQRAIVFSETQRQECGAGCSDYALVDGTRDCTIGGNKFRFAKEGTNAHCGPAYQEFGVMKTIVHPRYRVLQSGVAINDIALIKLSRPAVLSSEGNSLISPICLPLRQDYYHEGTVVGWGKTYVNDGAVSTVSSAQQKKLKMPLINITECGNVMSNLLRINLRKDIIEEHHLCAGGVRGKDSCSGDSGGPLLVKKDPNSPYTLAGVVSFGSARCGIGAPSVFTRITSKLQWIKDNLI